MIQVVRQTNTRSWILLFFQQLWKKPESSFRDRLAHFSRFVVGVVEDASARMDSARIRGNANLAKTVRDILLKISNTGAGRARGIHTSAGDG